MLVETHGLTKRYQRVAALEDCTTGVARGEIFGLLGPNGAGKTTLLRLLLGFLRPTCGRATIDGLDCQRDAVRVRHRLAYLPGDARLFRQMRGRKVLEFFAAMRAAGNLPRALQLAAALELDLSRRVAFMSTGMRQKLALVATLAAETPLLILDEPTANLDPSVRATVLELVCEARRSGRTVIFSSHVLSEVEEVCDRVLILRDGRPIHTQALADLRRRHRIRARPAGSELPPPPPHLQPFLEIRTQADREVWIDTDGELSSLLGWLATLSLAEVRIESLGLRAVYDRYHPPPSRSANVLESA